MKPHHNIVILIAPPSYHFYEDRFFSLDGSLNRDGTLIANHQMREKLRKVGYPVHTADQYETISQKFPNVQFHFWSFGAASKTALAFNGRNVRKIGAGLFEPPLVKPDDYRKISKKIRKLFGIIKILRLRNHDLARRFCIVLQKKPCSQEIPDNQGFYYVFFLP